ncbi:MAG: Gfo/Idh/MocA family oxidoreductase [Bacteroidaceae bacterium]|nr:Gfo/Idh/MocA family oxidoreductase [Bacteroidaceae bacterium]
MQTRRDFLKTGMLSTAGLALAGMGVPLRSFARTLGANDRVRVGVIGFSDRFRSSLLPTFMANAKELNFEIVAVSDIWKLRREEAVKHFKEKYNLDVKAFRNNEELFDAQICDAVIISTADFQHAQHCIQAVKAGCDAYVEKPFAETMEDARAALKAVRETQRIVQVGSQRRSAPNYQAAYDYLRSGKFGKITMVEMTWNVNQPGRWRRPALVEKCFEQDTDWKRFLLNRPYEKWDPRKYLEYRLFWPFSSGIPGQWMSHQIDTVHWFTGLAHPQSVAANGGIYCWNDGRRNFDTVTAVFDYGKPDGSDNFQVLYTSRMHNSAGGTKELYFSNGGTLNLDSNEVSSLGGMSAGSAREMGMQANLLESFKLPDVKVETSANTGGDTMTYLHMRNWMECVRSRRTPNAPAQAGYNHSIATIMCNAALRTGEKVTFNEKKQEVLAGGKVFKY